MNIITVIGRWTKDPEIRYTPGNNTAVANCSIAVTNTFRKGNDGKPTADFFNVTIWGKQAESVEKYTKKGSQVGISGRLETGSYEAKDGTKRYTTTIVANQVQFLDSKGGSSSQSPSEPTDNNDSGLPPVDDSDIPF